MENSVLFRHYFYYGENVIRYCHRWVSSDKTFFIIPKKSEELRRFILSELHRGGSIVPVNGMWNRSEKEMIMTVVNRKEVTTLQRAIQHIDPHAFTMILNAQEIMGQGFKRMDWDDNK